MRDDILIEVTMKHTVFWYVIPHSQVELYWCVFIFTAEDGSSRSYKLYVNIYLTIWHQFPEDNIPHDYT